VAGDGERRREDGDQRCQDDAAWEAAARLQDLPPFWVVELH
jgi:hypothetical protein